MASTKQPDHYVVDGSNIATEGRSLPSLEQLNDAVIAFKRRHADAAITVIVDATFGHRIKKNERKDFDDAVANNELVTPPAGAVGRGDAFVLTIADQSGAGVLSNDSFQEFHGDYPWLFDNGRLIGGKPVPNVGWVFVDRTPVRGPKSRQAIRDARNDKSADRQAEKKKASSRVRRKGSGSDDNGSNSSTRTRSSGTGGGRSKAGDSKSSATPAATPARNAASGDQYVNDQMEFIEFVGQCPVGTRLKAHVASYSSHGAYATVGSIQVYLPLRYLAQPTPRSAKQVVTVGAEVEVIIVGFTPDRRSIDAALPDTAQFAMEQEHQDPAAIQDEVTDLNLDAEAGTGAASTAPATQRAAKKSATSKRASTAKSSTAKKSSAKKTTAAKKSAAKKSAAKKSVGKQASAASSGTKKQAAAKKAAAQESATSKRASTAKKTSAKKTSAKKSSAKKTTAKQSAAKKSSAKKTTSKRTTAKKQASATAARARSGNIRVRELADELGRSNADVLAVCDQLGLAAKTHASSLTPDHADLVRTAAGG